MSNTILYLPSSSSNRNVCSFKLSKKLGEGTFGIVRLATNVQTGEEVAIKIIEKSRITTQEDNNRICNERNVLHALRHGNIVQLYSIIENDEFLYLIMEYVHGKELFEYIIDHTRLSEVEACKYYQQIISGIEYLHVHKIVHRDIKPENLLIDVKTKELKIVDFGLSNVYGGTDKEDTMLKSACGSPSYAAPEMLDGKEYKAAPVDIWSSGIVLYGMVCGFLPFEDDGNDNEALYKKIMGGRFGFPPWLSENCKDLIRKILTTDPQKRITIQNIKKHPWFNQVNQSTNINEGLLLNEVVVPIDEGIVNEMEMKYGYKDKAHIRECVLRNSHNDVTTIYYLIARKQIRKGYKSVVNIKSKLFLNYIHDNSNSLAKYHHDINEVIAYRKDGIAKEKHKTLSKSLEKHTTSSSTNNIQPLPHYDKASLFNSPQVKPYKRIYINNTSNTKRQHNITCTSDMHKRNTTSKSLNKKGVRINVVMSPGVRKRKRLFIDSKVNYVNTCERNCKSVKKDMVKENDEEGDEMKRKRFEEMHRMIKTTPNFSPQQGKSRTGIGKKDKEEEMEFVNLGCISMKSKGVIKKNMERVLNGMKVKYTLQSKMKFVIYGNGGDGLVVECGIVEVNKNKEQMCNVVKFKKRLGSMGEFNKLTRKILNKIEI